MTFLDELGLKAAEQLENAVGPFVALASYKRLLGAPIEVRLPAVFGALRCAVALGDEREVRELSTLWRTLPRGAAPLGGRSNDGGRATTTAALVVRLASTGRFDLAATVASAEVERNPTAHARYVLARASEQVSGPDLALWGAAVEAASEERNAALLTRSVARWLELALFSTRVPRLARPVREEIARRAVLCDLTGASAAEKLVVLRARLLSPGRFARAAALSGLEELARTGPAGVRDQAVLACARYVDVAGDGLDAVEIDRARAALSRWPREAEREKAMKRLDARIELGELVRERAPTSIALDRAAALVEAAAPEAAPHVHRARVMARGGAGGGAASGAEATPSSRLVAWGLDAVAAIGRAHEADAAVAMTRATEAMPPLSAVPAVLWAGARAALRSKSAGTRRAAAALVEQALSRSASAPSCGFSTLADELRRSGFVAVAELAFREAVRLREPGAAVALGDVERSLAYAALAKGDRRGALEALRDARQLLKGRPT